MIENFAGWLEIVNYLELNFVCLKKNGGREQLLSLLDHLSSLIQIRSLLHLIDYDFSRFDQQIRSVIFCLAGGLSKNTNS
jgi:hypothetical protein